MSPLSHLRAATAFTVFALLVLPSTSNAAAEDKVVLLPHPQAGQTLNYEINGRVQRQVITKSRVTSLFQPSPLREVVRLSLLFTVRAVRQENGRPVVDASVELTAPADTGATSAIPVGHRIEFTIRENGQIEKITGLDHLDPGLRLAWQFWIARFAFVWTLPAGGVKPDETWKSEEREESPVPIDKLFWQREMTYGQNARCPISPSESCAVFLTNATLKQKSPPKDTTPEDFRMHDLKTSGSASGTNEIFTTVSLPTGLLQRATEDVKQFMEVTVAKTDGSNSVHYSITATSHFETVFVPPAPSPSAITR